MIKKLSLLLICVFAAAIPAKASPEAQIQLAVATPDPIKAGETLTYQIVFVNTGSTDWTAGKYNVVIELYDSTKKFIKKVTPSQGVDNVSKGGSALFLISDTVPEYYSGQYLYRVSLNVNGRSVLTSDMLPFFVKSTAEKKEKKPQKLNITGNSMLSNKLDWKNYSSTASSDTSEYLGNFSLNALGKLAYGTLVFNMSAYKEDGQTLDLYSVYANLSGASASVELGDVMPYFSNLSLNGQTGRGISLSYFSDAGNAGFASMKIADAQEGSSSTSGTYARYLIGMHGDKTFMDMLNLGLTAQASFDDESSISIPGEGNNAVSASKLGMSASVNYGSFKLGGEYALSNLTEKLDYSPNVSSSAYAAETELSFSDHGITANAKYYLVEPAFVSHGSPQIYSDRTGYEGGLYYSPLTWMSLSANYDSYNDNVEEKPESERVTTNQLENSYGFNLYPRGLPSIGFSYGSNSVWSDPEGSLENETLTRSISLGYSLSNHFISAGFSLSGFEDKTEVSPELKTQSTSLNYTGALSKKLNLSAGYSISNVEDVDSGTDNKTNSMSVGLTVRIIPNRTSMVLYESLVTRDDNTNNAENSDLRLSTELTHKLNDSFSVTLGGGITDYNDKVDDTNTYTGYNVLVRGLYNF